MITTPARFTVGETFQGHEITNIFYLPANRLLSVFTDAVILKIEGASGLVVLYETGAPAIVIDQTVIQRMVATLRVKEPNFGLCSCGGCNGECEEE